MQNTEPVNHVHWKKNKKKLLKGESKVYLAENEGVEYECVESFSGMFTREIHDFFPTELENSKDCNLVYALTYNVSPHGLGDEVDVSSNWWPLHQTLIWRFCGQCQGA